MTLKIALCPLFSWSFALFAVVGGVGNVGVFRVIDSCCEKGIIFFAEVLGALCRIPQPVMSMA